MSDISAGIPLLPSSQWRIEQIQLVNWGGFHQRTATFAFHPETTIVTGASGVGKSTVLDAYLALMMPSDVPFNGASNAATVGRARGAEQRSVLTYLRGKTDDTVEDGVTVDKVLRGQGKPTWGAIAATFIAETGDRFTAMRAYFVPVGVARDGDVVKRMMTIPGSFEIRQLGDFARVGSESYPAKAMKQKWSELRIYGSYGEFSQALFSRLGIGQGGDGANALALLARIQAGTMSPTVDDLYKRLVIEIPETFRVADEAIATFDELDEMYRKMETSQHQADLLAPVPDLYEEMVAAQRDIAQARALGAIDDDNTPAGLWRLRTHSAILEREDGLLRERAAALQEQLRTATTATDEAERLLDVAKADYDAGGGDRDRQLTDEITRYEQAAEGRRGMRARLDDALADLDRVVDREGDLLTIHSEARAFPERAAGLKAELESKREQMIRDEHPLGEELKSVRAELRSLEGRSGRVDASMDARRREAADAAGLDAADLPFVAELIDVADGEDRWRGAIETVLYASARILLVPGEHLERFSRAIDPIRSSVRLNFEGVDRSVVAHTAPMDPQRIAGKLDYQDSPYQAWVIEHLSSPARNALCVSSTDGLAGEGLRVTPSGQTRQRRRGAHGGNTARPIIGFDNAGLKASLEAQQKDLRAQLAESERARARVAAEIQAVDKQHAAYLRTLDFSWVDVDVDTPIRHIAELRALQEKLLADDGVLAVLKKQVETLSAVADSARRLQHSLEGKLSEVADKRSALADMIDTVNDALWPLEENGSVTLDEALSTTLDQAWERVLASEAPTSGTWKIDLRRLERALADGVSRAAEKEASSRKQIERAFEQFQERWNDPTRGQTIDSYREYVAILDEIQRVGIHEQREQWRKTALQWSGRSLRLLGSAMSSAVDDIQARLDAVNSILERLPFGPTDGRLKIDMRRLAPQTVTTFRRELEAFKKLATQGAPEEQLVQRFTQMRVFVAKIRKRDDPALTAELRAQVVREEILDVRRHVEITAKQYADALDTDPVAEYSSLAGKSGGEMQELVAFIVGAALRFQLGDELGHLPRFAPVFLDEGFIKADSEYAGRAVEAWKGLGFQLIIGAPFDKYTGLERHVAQTILVSKNRQTGHSFVDHAYHQRQESFA